MEGRGEICSREAFEWITTYITSHTIFCIIHKFHATACREFLAFAKRLRSWAFRAFRCHLKIININKRFWKPHWGERGGGWWGGRARMDFPLSLCLSCSHTEGSHLMRLKILHSTRKMFCASDNLCRKHFHDSATACLRGARIQQIKQNFVVLQILHMLECQKTGWGGEGRKWGCDLLRDWRWEHFSRYERPG